MLGRRWIWATVLFGASCAHQEPQPVEFEASETGKSKPSESFYRTVGKADDQDSFIICNETAKEQSNQNYWKMDFGSELADHCFRKLCFIKDGILQCEESGQQELKDYYVQNRNVTNLPTTRDP